MEKRNLKFIKAINIEDSLEKKTILIVIYNQFLTTELEKIYQSSPFSFTRKYW